MNDQLALEEAAGPYRQEGYTVDVRPGEAALPSFLDHFQPDLIARKNGEQVVVVVRRMAELRGDQELGRVAGVVNAQPGWRFDLVVPAPLTPSEEAWAEGAEPSDAELDGLLDEARKLLDLGLPRPAFVAAWAAVEAAMRHLARQEEVRLPLRSPRFVLDALTSVGLLSRADYHLLVESLRQRDVAVHGMAVNGLSAEDTERLLGITRRLLDFAPATADV